MAIYPQVRLAACAAHGAPAFAHRPWLADHLICIVEGDDAGWRFLTEEELESHGGFEAALEHAQRNLDEVAQRPGSVRAYGDASGRVSCIVAENFHFVSGLMLRSALLDACRKHLGDDFLLCNPGADELVAFRGSDPENAANTALESFRTHEHPVSPHIYAFDGAEALQVRQRRDYDPNRLVLTTLEVKLAPAGTVVQKTPDSAWWSGQRVEPLSPDDAAALDLYRKVGASLLHTYSAAPDGRLSPPVLDAALRGWRQDTSPDRCDENAVACGLGSLLGDFYCAMLSGEWVSHHDSAGSSLAVRTQSGSVCHPIESIAKRIGGPDGSVEQLCRQLFESEGAL